MSCVSNLSILPSSDANVSKTDFALQYTIDMDAICKRYSEKHSLREILDACGHKRNKKYIQEFKFVPGGRILRSFAEALDDPSKSLTITPSCCVLPLHDAETRREMLSQSTGCGLSLNGIEPERFIETVLSICQEPKPVNGRTPGLMMTIDYRDPNAVVASKLKRRPLLHDCLNNVNISFCVPRSEMSEFMSSETGHIAAESAALCGDPGVLVVPSRKDVNQSTAPCGELWLTPYEACCLGDLLLPMFYDQRSKRMDWMELEKASEFAADFLNDMIDHMAIPQVMKDVVDKNRRIGVGVLGFADLLDLMGLKYGDPESIKLASDIAKHMRCGASRNESRHNVSVLAFAPTGGIVSLSLEYEEVGKRSISYSIEPIMSQALAIPAEKHLAVLNAFQSHVDGGISKTINLPSWSTADDVINIWRLCANSHVKGITVFVDGCLNTKCNLSNGKCTTCNMS